MSQNETRLDPRVQRTRQMLREALRSLIEERGEFDSLTIAEITERAGLNRATWYLHFHDKGDLLADLVDHLVSSVVPQPPDDGSLPMVSPFDLVLGVLNHVASLPDFYRALLGDAGVLAAQTRVRAQLEGLVLRWISVMQRPASAPFEAEIAAQYVSGAFIRVIGWWLSQGMPVPPDQLARQLIQMMTSGVPRNPGEQPPPTRRSAEAPHQG